MDELELAFEALRIAKRGINHVQGKTGKTAKADGKANGGAAPAKIRTTDIGVPDTHVRITPVPKKDARTEPQKRASVPDAEPISKVKSRSDIVPALPRALDVHPPGSTPLTDAAVTKFVQEMGYKGVRPPPFVPNDRDPTKWPKNHAPGSILPGDSVWYGSERFYVVCPPADWLTTSFVQISSVPVRPGQQIPRDAVYLSVHADALEKAPTRGAIFTSQPTKHAVEVQEKMKKEGVTDIGDEVGTLLRGKSLDETYPICAKYIGIPEDVLRAKYAHLNHGQQRMNLGNRMRAMLKKSREPR